MKQLGLGLALLALGAGFSHTPIPNLGLALYGGFSIGRERPILMARINGGQSLPALSLSGFWNKPIDLGPVLDLTHAAHDDFRAILRAAVPLLADAREGVSSA